MSLKYRTMLVVKARDIEKLYEEKYNRDIEICDLIFRDDYYNDSCKYFNAVDAEQDALWDLKVKLGYIPDNYDGDGSEFDINILEIEDCREKDIIRLCDLLYANGFTDTSLIDVSW